MNVSKSDIPFYAIALGLAGSLYFIPQCLPAHIGTAYIAVFLSMSVFSLWMWLKQHISPPSALVLSFLLCLVLAPLAPYLSNDTQRYIWDGTVFISGFDPYLTAPDDPLVSHLRAIWPTPEEHAQYPTLYPPGALTLFGICAMAGPVFSLWVWKGMITLAVLLSLILTYKLLERKQALKHFYLAGLSPLLIFETQLGGHLDILSVLGVVTALWFIDKDKLITAGIIIGLAATMKFLPAIIVGPFLFYLKPRRALALFIASAATWLSVYLLMFGLGYKPLGLLPTFFEKWRGGAPIYPCLLYTSDAADE